MAQMLYSFPNTTMIQNEDTRVRYVRSNNDFATETRGNFYSCSSHSSPTSCSGTQSVYSSHAISSAFSSEATDTVYAWTDADRGSQYLDGEILVSVGGVNHWTVRQPTSLGVNSHVRPGVACKSNAVWGNYDCLIAYVDSLRDGLDVRVERVEIEYSSTKGYYAYNDTISGTTAAGLKTAHGIELFWNQGYFWLAIVPTGVDNVKVYRSTNGLLWDYYATYAESMVGPSAIGVTQTNNYLTTIR